MNRRTERVGNLIRNVLGELLLRKLSDPRVHPERTSITHVEVPEDLLSAKVFISVLGTEAQQQLALRALRHASGHLQELLMEQISLRNTPILSFELDENFKKTLETYRVLQQVTQELREKEEKRAHEQADGQAAEGADAPAQEPPASDGPKEEPKD